MSNHTDIIPIPIPISAFFNHTDTDTDIRISFHTDTDTDIRIFVIPIPIPISEFIPILIPDTDIFFWYRYRYLVSVRHYYQSTKIWSKSKNGKPQEVTAQILRMGMAKRHRANQLASLRAETIFSKPVLYSGNFTDFLQTKLRKQSAALENKYLKYLKPKFMLLSKPHQMYTYAVTTYQANKCVPGERLLSGIFRLGSLVRHFYPDRVSGIWALCYQELEDIPHLTIQTCPRLTDRAKLLMNYVKDSLATYAIWQYYIRKSLFAATPKMVIVLEMDIMRL